jgi:hypothetical protein
VAEGAALRLIDLIVTHCALGHFRIHGIGHLIGFEQFVVAGFAGLVLQTEVKRVVEMCNRGF